MVNEKYGEEIDDGAKKYMDVFKKNGIPKMDGLQWKTLLKWMIWGTTIFGNIHMVTRNCGDLECGHPNEALVDQRETISNG